MSMPDTHVVLIRPLATGRWEILEYAKSAESALAKASQRRDDLSHGDLILAIDIAEISAIPERGECLYYVDKTGASVKAPEVSMSIHQPTWFLGWEGPDADAYKMLIVASRVDRKLFTMTTCAIARVALQRMLPYDNRLRAVIETAEAWARSKTNAEQVERKAAAEIASSAASHAYDEYIAVHHAYHGVYAAITHIHISRADPVMAYHAARAMPGGYGNIRQLSHIVREYIPLHVVLESLT